ncbi:hypothetical protein A3748_03330 [Erythrobacter sp. HI0077]|nr:hypothetical protein A3745_11270 [Erythrobacter sp. HI0074]KZZ06895.1 hypothetical protein A3748_03330 [Erythrobacter sp. HI0077]
MLRFGSEVSVASYRHFTVPQLATIDYLTDQSGDCRLDSQFGFGGIHNKANAELNIIAWTFAPKTDFG